MNPYVGGRTLDNFQPHELQAMPARSLAQLIEATPIPPKNPKRISIGGGLFIKLYPNGTRSFEYRYEEAGKTKQISCGKLDLSGFGKSLEAARKRAQRYAGLRADGLDPAEEKKGRRLALQIQIAVDRNAVAASKRDGARRLLTVETVARQWFAQYTRAVAARSRNNILRSLESHVFPIVGAKPIHTITHHQLEDDVLEPLLAQYPAAAEGVFHRLGMIWRYAARKHGVETTPVTVIQDWFYGRLKDARDTEQHARKHYPWLPIEACGPMLQAVRTAPNCAGKALLQLGLLTCKRPTEVRLAKWDEFDLDSSTWTIPGSRMKRKRRGGDHVAPLSRQAVALLRALYVLRRSDSYVFAQRNPNKVITQNHARNLLDSLGYKGKHTPHGTRRTFSTAANEQSKVSREWDSEVIEIELDHIEGDVRSVYNKATYMEPRRALMQWWADRLDQAEGVNVVPFNKPAVA